MPDSSTILFLTNVISGEHCILKGTQENLITVQFGVYVGE